MELKTLHTKCAELEAEAASSEGSLNASRREWKAEGSKLRDDVAALHRKVLAGAEREKSIKEAMKRMEREHAQKTEKNEER